MASRIHTLLQRDDHLINDSIRMYINDQPTGFPQHRNMAYEMIMPVENIYTVCADGDTVVLQPGDLIIIPSGIIHEITAPPSGKRYYFMLDRDRLFSIKGLQEMEHYFYPYLLVRAGSCEHLDRFIAAVDEYTADSVWGHTIAHLELSMLLISILREQFTPPAAAVKMNQTKKDQRQLLFVDISNYIANHCTESLTPQAMADAAGYNRFYFERLFEEYMNMSFHDHLIHQRLELSKQLLQQSSDAITEVAHRSGFNSIATFNRLFRKAEGMTPSEYRLQKALR